MPIHLVIIFFAAGAVFCAYKGQTSGDRSWSLASAVLALTAVILLAIRFLAV